MSTRNALSADLIATRTALTADIVGARTELHALAANAALIEHRVMTRLDGLVVVVAGLLFGALHLWPPH